MRIWLFGPEIFASVFHTLSLVMVNEEKTSFLPSADKAVLNREICARLRSAQHFGDHTFTHSSLGKERKEPGLN